MDGLSINTTPFKREVSAVIEEGSASPCYHFTMEFHVAGQNVDIINIVGVESQRDYIQNYYPIKAVEFTVTATTKEFLIANMDKLEVTFKTYELPRNAPYALANLRNPVIKRYKAKLYLAESDYVTQDNFAANNAEYMDKKLMVSVKVQLVDKGFEELKNRYVGGGYRGLSGASLLRHLVDYHANLDNDDVATLINGVQMAPNANEDVKETIQIKDGTSLIQAMHEVNENCGGVYPTGFSYFIFNNIWYIFPPYALNRFNEAGPKLIIVNLPKNRLPGIETTFNARTETVIILSTGETITKDKRESKKLEEGTGIRFADASRLLNGFGEAIGNKLNVNAANNVNDLQVTERADGVNALRFSKVKLTASKNLELSKLAPSKGFIMRLSWENGNEDLILPGMPVKVLYLKRNKATSAVGTVIGVYSTYYPFEAAFPAKKFAIKTYIDVFVSNEQDES